MPLTASPSHDLAEVAASDAALRRFLHGLPGVDQVGADARAAMLGSRSVKTSSKAFALDLAVRMVDLTTLEGQDTPGKVRALASKAVRPDPTDPACPSVAAVCVYPDLVTVAKETVQDSGVQVASVATAFPAGLSSFETKIREIELSVAAGATEIDIVITRQHVLTGNWQALYDEMVAYRQACGEAHVKAILATGDIVTLDNVAKASMVCMMAGADFIKTSTGKEGVNATIPVSLVMVRAIREYYEQTGFQVGYKPAGGVSTAKSALQYLTVMKEELGNEWLQPHLFRIGASSLMTDIERQLEHYVTGAYSAAHRHAQP